MSSDSTDRITEAEHRAERAEALCDAYAKAYPAITLAEFDAKYAAELDTTDGPGGTG